MVVRIRFGRGKPLSRGEARNARMALLAGSALTMTAIACASLGLWRVGADLDLAGPFVYASGLRSHWQVWIGAAALLQYIAWRLGNYAEAEKPESIHVRPDGVGEGRTAAKA